jgi:hypothetical protein
MALYPQETDMFEVASMLSQKECKNRISIIIKKQYNNTAYKY